VEGSTKAFGHPRLVKGRGERKALMKIGKRCCARAVAEGGKKAPTSARSSASPVLSASNDPAAPYHPPYPCPLPPATCPTDQLPLTEHNKVYRLRSRRVEGTKRWRVERQRESAFRLRSRLRVSSPRFVSSFRLPSRLRQPGLGIGRARLTSQPVPGVSSNRADGRGR
jgi:hypothetical protein